MAHKVGNKGQIVIEKPIRDRLGLEPGWLAVQRLVDDHLEVHFVPPKSDESLMGSLEKYLKGTVPSDKDWHGIKESAWRKAVEERWGRDGEVS